MADKIVQLIDKDGNNIFPVATMPMTNYSTVEQDTGFTWIDGRAIYKKTFSDTTGSNNGSTKTIAHSISGFASLIKAEGTVLNGTQYWQIPTSFGSEGWAAIRADSTNIYLNVYGNSLAGKSCNITLYYTKTN